MYISLLYNNLLLRKGVPSHECQKSEGRSSDVPMCFRTVSYSTGNILQQTIMLLQVSYLMIASVCCVFYITMSTYSCTISFYCILLLSRFSHVRLCATPEMTAHQAPPSLGFSRQEHWSGLPFPSPMRESEKWKSLSHVRLLATPWTAAYQAPPSMGFSRQEYWSGVPLPSPFTAY